MECLNFQAELIFENSKVAEVQDFTLDSRPATFLDIKKEIEKSFSIPVCVQTLFYQSCKVSDSDNPLSWYVRSGDMFTVHYPAKGDCKRVLKAVDWLNKLTAAVSKLKQGKDRHKEAVSDYKRLTSMEYIEISGDLCRNMIVPWSDKTKHVNRFYFDSLGGVELVINLYRLIVEARLDNVTLRNSLYLENVFCLFVANFAQTLPLVRRVFMLGGLELCMKSLLYSPVNSELKSLSRRTGRIVKDALYALSK